jgi:hypothetical protein
MVVISTTQPPYVHLSTQEKFLKGSLFSLLHYFPADGAHWHSAFFPLSRILPLAELREMPTSYMRPTGVLDRVR